MRTTKLLRDGATLATAPISVMRRAVSVTTQARQHPASTELHQLLKRGYHVERYDYRTDSVTVTVRRGDDVRDVVSSDLAFAAYAAKVVPRVVAARLDSERRRVFGT